MSGSRFRVPHTLALLFGMCVVALLATYVLPQGEFERVDRDGHQVVVAGSFTPIEEGERLNPLRLFTAIPRGFAAAEQIIFFVFIVGGAFGVLKATGAVNALIGFLLERFGDRPTWLIVVGVMMFAIGSSTIGMAEEYLMFTPILVALCLGLGYDTLTAVGIICCGYSVGYGVAVINPFTVLIAQGVAEVQPTSGMAYRLVLSVFFIAVAVHHVWRYASKVRADPSASYVADIEVDASQRISEHPALTGKHVAVLAVTAGMVGLMVHGLGQWSGWGWYVGEMGAVFLGLVVLIGIIGRLSVDRVASSFCSGAAELTTTALLIGVARTIQVILDDGKVVDTIVNGIAQPLQALGSHTAAVGMLVVQSLCNFFIPSGSGQAYVTMPIMSPLSDIVGVSRQTAVLAYQFGDGFSNVLVPTSVVLMGILAIARVPYDRWLRFVMPFMFKMWALAAIALVVAVVIGYR